MATLKNLAATRLGVSPSKLLGFRQLDFEVVVIAPDGRKYRFSIKELEEGETTPPQAAQGSNSIAPLPSLPPESMAPGRGKA